MPTPLASQIQDVLPRTRDAYYKLVLAVGPARKQATQSRSRLTAAEPCRVHGEWLRDTQHPILMIG